MPSPNIIDVKSRIDRVAGVYGRADAEIRGILAQFQYPATGRQRQAITKRVQGVITELGEKRDPYIAGLIKLAYSRGYHLVDPEDKVTSKDAPAIRLMINSLTIRLGSAEATLVRNFRDAVRRTMLLTSAAAVRNSQDSSTVRSTALNPAAFVDRSGARWSMAQYAEMAIRTVAHETLTEGTLAAMKAHKWDLVNVSKDPIPSPTCAPFDGKTFSIGGKDPEYPALSKFPPFHPSCEHFIYYVGLT